MEKSNFEGSLKEAFVGIKHYLDLQVKYQKLVLTKKLSELSSLFILFLLILGISAFILVFLSLSFVEWYASYGDRLHGRLIVTLFYLLLLIIIIVFRKGLLFSPMRRLLGNILLDGDEDPKAATSYKTKEALDSRIKNYKDILKTEEEDLKEKFEDVSENFSVLNIVQGIFKSAYKSFITASNIAKMTYSLVNKLKGGKKKKKKKGKKSPELEEGNE